MRARRDELFPTDRGLVARMAAVALLTPLIVLAGLIALAAVAPPNVLGVAGLAVIVGIFAAIAESEGRRAAREVSARDAPELHAVVERLCVLADLPKPAIVVEAERQPNSWVVGTGRGRYRLHLTKGLLARLEPHELEAVIAHELAHIAHRDAAVMTVIGGPAAVLLGGGVRVARGGWWPMMLGAGAAALIGWLASHGARALSRYREYAADAGAVALTGSAAALASALVKVSDGMVSIPTADLRAAAARDAFHLLPAASGRYGLPQSHPPLRERIARLERLERTLQANRPRRG